jgi:hypothetical protein
MQTGVLANLQQTLANLRRHCFTGIDFNFTLASRHQQATRTEYQQRQQQDDAGKK